MADKFAAVRTPEVFVLDKDRVVRYWGRIDDQYGFADGLGYQRPEPSRSDLAEAVNELLAGKSVSVPMTEALGCHIGRVHEANENSEVTYSDQIARIFQDHCVECHRAGPHRPVRDDQLRGRCWAGANDSRSGRSGAHAPLARQSALRRVCQRYDADR